MAARRSGYAIHQHHRSSARRNNTNEYRATAARPQMMKVILLQKFTLDRHSYRTMSLYHRRAHVRRRHDEWIFNQRSLWAGALARLSTPYNSNTNGWWQMGNFRIPAVNAINTQNSLTSSGLVGATERKREGKLISMSAIVTFWLPCVIYTRIKFNYWL